MRCSIGFYRVSNHVQSCFGLMLSQLSCLFTEFAECSVHNNNCMDCTGQTGCKFCADSSVCLEQSALPSACASTAFTQPALCAVECVAASPPNICKYPADLTLEATDYKARCDAVNETPMTSSAIPTTTTVAATTTALPTTRPVVCSSSYQICQAF